MMSRLLFLAALSVLLLPLSANAQYALQFGAAVESDGEAIYVGEGRNLLQNGSVFMYAPDDAGTWAMSGRVQASDPGESGNGFGRSMEIAGDVMVVGAPLVSAVYVFERSPAGEWVEMARLSSEGADDLGTQVATTGSHIFAASMNAAGETAVHSWVRSRRVASSFLGGARWVSPRPRPRPSPAPVTCRTRRRR